MPVTFVNEFGEKETRRVFKQDYITRLAIFPFTNESIDSSKNWLQYGIRNAIFEDLLQFNYLLIGFNDIDASHLQEQIKYTTSNYIPYFLTGAFRITDGNYQITSKLYQTANGAIMAERVFRGSDFFSLIDSVSLQARIDLGITNNILNSSVDLPLKEYYSGNLDAIQHLIKGSIDSFNFNLNKAIELDSTFALALYTRAIDNYNFQISYERACKDVYQAMRHRQRLVEYRELRTRILYYSILKENDKAIALAELQHELHPENIRLLTGLIDTYNRNFLIHKLEKVVKHLNELVPDHPGYQILLARSYLLTRKLDEGMEVLEKLLKANPENTGALMQMGEICLHKNDPEAAERFFKKAILLSPEDEKWWSMILDHIEYARKKPITNDFLEPFTGNYRTDDGEMNILSFIHHNNLIWKPENQYAYFRYPVSDNQFISYNGYMKYSFVRSKQDKVIKNFHKQRNIPDTRLMIDWKEDSLITRAQDLLHNDFQAEALNVFREAYDQNPEHYYLAHFIQHLEYIKNPDYEKFRSVFGNYLGNYSGLYLYNEQDQYYYKDKTGFIYRVLSLSEDKFMIPSSYNTQIHIIKEKDTVTGLKFLYQDGKEIFYARAN